MAAITDLINQVEDKTLRERLLAEAARLTKQKKFGLVFEDHLPECTPLYGIPVKRGSTVAKKSGAVNDTYRVVSIDGDQASCVKNIDGAGEVIPVDELVAVAQFGEPIYPTLLPLDSVQNDDENGIWHTLIEADNYHALQLLSYLYPRKVDCIYIDPPYNTGARDWKYNNDYVDSSDAYRHSKWLSMMEKRLAIAKGLLAPDGVMVVAIDDYEVAHLILLLEDIFPEYDISTVIVNHHPQGGAADNISRTHEYALFVTRKGQKIIKGNRSENLEESWSLTRGGTDVRNLRKGRPNSFYAIYVDKETLEVKGVGPHLDADTPYDKNDAPDGCRAFYPVGKDGTERVWRYERASMTEHIKNGDIVCSPKGTLSVVKRRDVKYDPVFSVWTDGRYNAGTYGTNMIYSLFAKDNRFSYPKSLYTVKDCVQFSIQDKPNALVIDFFAGSGTTLHAVNLLNAEDGGHRRCILVTNNEVSDEESKVLTDQGFKPGDEGWEAHGIAHYVTWPRTVCSIEGHDIIGAPLNGEYIDRGIKMSDGFKANCEFFKLGFLDKNEVALGTQFKEILPLLWLKAGAVGKRPEIADGEHPNMLVLPQNKLAILMDESVFMEFDTLLDEHPEIETVFIVTDSERAYREMISGLKVQNTYQLYRDYLDNFRINARR